MIFAAAVAVLFGPYDQRPTRMFSRELPIRHRFRRHADHTSTSASLHVRQRSS